MVQPHKGDRVVVTARLPRAYYDKLSAVVKAEGATRQDYLLNVLCAHLDSVEAQEQEELPLAKIA